MLKKFILLTSILIIIVLAGCNNQNIIEQPPLPSSPYNEANISEDTGYENPYSPVTLQSLRFKAEYEELNGELNDNGDPYEIIDVPPYSTVVYLEEDELMEFLESGTGILFFANGSCPWCRTLIPPLLDFGVAKDTPLYYFNPVADREADTALHQFIKNILHDILPVDNRSQSPEDVDFDPEKKRVTVPQIFYFRDGKVITDLFMNRHDLLQRESFDETALFNILDEHFQIWLMNEYG